MTGDSIADLPAAVKTFGADIGDDNYHPGLALDAGGLVKPVGSHLTLRRATFERRRNGLTERERREAGCCC